MTTGHMTTGQRIAPQPVRRRTPARPGPEQSSCRVRLSPPQRIIRQVEAIDAWVTARREREQVLDAPSMSRDQRMDVVREIDVLQRVHDAIKDRCAGESDAEMDPLQPPAVTAVLAHRHAWFLDKLALLLDGHGLTVLLCTDNGAEALGAVVAEQPDLVLVGSTLAMTSGRTVLAESRRYAPNAYLTAQASTHDEAEALCPVADSVFLRHRSPADIADTLIALSLEMDGDSTTA